MNITKAPIRSVVQPIWRIELLGSLRAVDRRSGRTISRFRTQKTGALLAYLAYFAGRPHSREVLIDLLWPDATPEAGRHNLCNALSSLRHQLEPPGVSAGAVFTANRFTIQFNPGDQATDVGEFLRALSDSTAGEDAKARTERLAQALDGYGGTLLPGYYEGWIVAEQERLQDRFLAGIGELIGLLRQQGQLERAIGYARRATGLAPLHEASQIALIELLGATGQPAAALRQYREYERLLQREPDGTPSQAVQRASQQAAMMKAAPTRVATSLPTAGKAPVPSTAGEPVPSLPQQPVAYIPPRWTRFFGRALERKRICELLSLQETRLLTLTGPGGIGKTRLAVEVADSLRAPFADAVWFVPLVDLTEAVPIDSAVAEVLRVSHLPEGQHHAQIVEILSQRRSLLVLDNFEHLVESSAALWVQGLLERVPTLTCFVTSRRRLNLSSERVFYVASLPPTNGAMTPETVVQVESVRLFVDRAQAVRPDFQVTSHNARALAELCDRLDGIPLAIELAAARAQVMTPAQMLQQMAHRFDFLVSRARDGVERHRALRATLDWSYRLLAPELQRFCAQLSIFRGGWTREAAEAVCVEPLALDFLAQLHECSLVQAEEVGAEIRFRMLETVREYAAERLEAQDIPLLAQRYAATFLAFAEAAEPLLTRADSATCMDRLEADHDNLRSVLDWAQRSPGEKEREIGMRIGVALRLFWLARGYGSEGRARLQALASHAPGEHAPRPTLLHAAALGAAGTLAQEQGEYAAAAELQEASLALHRQHKNVPGIATALRSLAVLARRLGDANHAILLYEESLSLHTQLNDLPGVAGLLNGMGIAVFRLGDPDRARALYEQSLSLYRQLEDRAGIARVLNNLGDLIRRQGDCERAITVLEESVALNRQLGYVSYAAVALNSLAVAHQELNRDEQAATCYREGLLFLQRSHSRWGVSEGLEGIAEICLRQDQMTSSVQLFAAAAALRETMQTPLGDGDGQHITRLLTLLRASMNESQFERAWAVGYSMQWQRALAHALELPLEFLPQKGKVGE